MEKQKIKFRDLDVWLKVPVVLFWILAGIWAFSFIVYSILEFAMV